MTTKKPNFIIKFDGQEYSKEEQNFLINRFVLCLMKLSAKQESQKFKTKREQKGYEQNFTDFGLKALQDMDFAKN